MIKVSSLFFSNNHAVRLNFHRFSALKYGIIKAFPRIADFGLYELYTDTQNDSEETTIKAYASSNTRSLLWNNRLIYVNAKVLRSLSVYASGILKLRGELLSFFPCKMGKDTKKYFKSKLEEAKCAGEIIHVELVVKLPTSIESKMYFITLTDQHTRLSYTAGMRKKSDTAVIVELHKKRIYVFNYFSEGIQYLHADVGG